MRILCAFIFICVLQSASLEKAEPITTQQKQDVTKPKIPPETNPEAAVEQTPDVNLEKGADTLSKPKPGTEADKSPDTLSEPKSDPNLEPKSESDADQRSDVEETTDSDIKSTTESPNTNSQQNPANTPEKGQAKPKETGPRPTKPEPRPTKPGPKSTKEDFFWGPPQCEQQNYTRLSCSKVFCPPWRRCIAGVCVCQMPYKCPRQDTRACTLDGAEFYSMCQTNAIACRANKPTFSHFSRTCKTDENVQTTFRNSGDKRVLEIHSKKGKMLVCGSEWNIAAANVFCRNDSTEYYRGAERASKMQYVELEGEDWPDQCMKVRCTGSELSLAECTIYNPTPIKGKQQVAVANCYNETTKEQSMKFRCVNGKYVNYGKLCDGIDDCGDNSDEMCCQDCQKKNNAFWCPSGVCIPRHAVRDGVRDCLGGEDELEENGPIVENDPKEFFTDPLAEIKKIRSTAESKLQCGVPNMDYVYKAEDDGSSRQRRKRLVGGEESLPTQIQWQVAIQDEGSIHCGGVYLGGCWVLTAAHCVRPKPKSFRVKFSLWRKNRKQSTTDSIPVKKIIIHENYDAQTYVNDIALVQLEELNLSDKCMLDNPAIRAVCVPWSTQQFQPNDTCTISGWGRDKAGMSASILKWANVTIIGDCQNFYKHRFLPGMECAGDLEGKVDSCQGDSGGPLVCKDASGLSYVWGIVSWGDKCGEPNHPGVYTKVAHYFDWIRFNTGWAAVTKFNQ